MQGFEGAFKGTGVSGYPGGPFNPLGLGNSSKESMDDYKQREIKNGRLAMLAFLGFLAQHAATGKGPLDNLAGEAAQRSQQQQQQRAGLFDRAGGGLWCVCMWREGACVRRWGRRRPGESCAAQATSPW